MPIEIVSAVSIEDMIFTPIYLLVIFVVAAMIRYKYIAQFPYYKYFIPGLALKLFGSIGMCFVYIDYYQGGDTVNYFFSSQVLLELLKSEPGIFFKILLLGEYGPQYFYYFSSSTGYPLYFNDPLSFFVVRMLTPFVFVSGQSYFTASILFTCLSYTGIWKLYQVFVTEFPSMSKPLAIGVFFIPSVFFWGSGILKDPITLAAVGWFTYAVYWLIEKKKISLFYFIYLFISSYILLSIKPYIFYVLVPCSTVWLLFSFLKNIKSGFIKSLTFPLLIVVFGAGTYLLLDRLGQDRAKFSLGQILETAKTTQEDLKREAYGGSVFDLGTFDANIGSMLTKLPLAVNAALFRPYLWEARNPVMLASALENTFILILTIYLLFKVNVVRLMRIINQNPILFFSIIYAILFAFSVGISTPNFGSLVRYKIPAIPFYVTTILVIINESKRLYDVDRAKANLLK